MTFIPTPEQQAIYDAVRGTTDNLLIEALAGAAKTTTLVGSAKFLPLTPTLSVAFNKKIADEMAQRMPSHITSKTLNSVGHGVWGKRIGRRANVDTSKTFEIIKAVGDGARGSDKDFIRENFSSLKRGISLAKANGYIPEGDNRKIGKTLLDTDEFVDSIATELDCEPDATFVRYLDEGLARSIASAFDGTIDFDDQLYMPTLFGGDWPKYPIVLVDEAQDLSPLNHQMLEKMYAGRLIAVGDRFQSIYGFRGAHSSSMAYLGERFNMSRLDLTTSFRCPQNVVRKANGYVPKMRFPEWAIEGKVDNIAGQAWNADSIPAGAAIICRNNAPLFSLALKLLAQRRGVKIYGSELGPAITKQLRKIGGRDDSISANDLMDRIEDWERNELRSARESRRAVIHDKAECYRVFAAFGKNLGEAIAYAETLFKQGGEILLMTGHKSKGLEFDHVIHLDPWRIPSKYALRCAEFGDESKLTQERNLDYVITTRAKQTLTLANLEDFE